VHFEVLARDGCIRREPALAHVREKFVGGLLLPGDETGDCFLFTQQLAALAAERGVVFRHGVTIRRLLSDGTRLTGVETDIGRLEAEATLLALGSHSPLLLRPIGIHVPVYPVKGYSITLPIVDPRGAPESTVMDETHKVAVTRLGERIRVGGTAELAGYSLQLHEARRRTLAHVVGDLFPQGGDIARAEFWCGLRPMTPDGTPVIGGTRLPNLFLATGRPDLGARARDRHGRPDSGALSGRVQMTAPRRCAPIPRGNAARLGAARRSVGNRQAAARPPASARWFDAGMLSRASAVCEFTASIHCAVLATAAKRVCMTTLNTRWISSALALPALLA
jgi:D-amino-acid dehydrogenase